MYLIVTPTSGAVAPIATPCLVHKLQELYRAKFKNQSENIYRIKCSPRENYAKFLTKHNSSIVKYADCKISVFFCLLNMHWIGHFIHQTQFKDWAQGNASSNMPLLHPKQKYEFVTVVRSQQNRDARVSHTFYVSPPNHDKSLTSAIKQTQIAYSLCYSTNYYNKHTYFQLAT